MVSATASRDHCQSFGLSRIFEVAAAILPVPADRRSDDICLLVYISQISSVSTLISPQGSRVVT